MYKLPPQYCRCTYAYGLGKTRAYHQFSIPLQQTSKLILLVKYIQLWMHSFIFLNINLVGSAVLLSHVAPQHTLKIYILGGFVRPALNKSVTRS